MIPKEAWPAGDMLAWDDDDTRLHHDFTADPWATTPYTDEENAAADERALVADRAAAPARLREEIVGLLDQEPRPLTRAMTLVETLARLALEVL